MNFVHFSPHFPPNYYLFARNLKDLGATVLGLGDENYDLLNPELRNSMTEYFRVGDMHNYDELVRALGFYTHKYGKLDRIESMNEYWLETEARLRTDFNISGLGLSDIAHVKRKSEMKERFRMAGVDVVPGVVVHNLKDAVDFAKDAGFPLVAKPDIGVGAARTYRLNNNKDLERFIAEKPPVDYFLESFVPGTIQTFDGLTDQDGNVVFSSSLQYSQGIMETVNQDTDIYYYTQREIPADLEKAGIATAQAFDVRERFFHFEYFRTPDNRIVGLEVNLRPPGGPTMDMMNFANQIDLYREYAYIVMYNRFTATYTRDLHCCYVGRKANKRYQLSHDEVIIHYGARIAHHEPISGIFSQALGNYAYLVLTPDFDEMIDIANGIQRKQN